MTSGPLIYVKFNRIEKTKHKEAIRAWDGDRGEPSGQAEAGWSNKNPRPGFLSPSPAWWLCDLGQVHPSLSLCFPICGMGSPHFPEHLQGLNEKAEKSAISSLTHSRCSTKLGVFRGWGEVAFRSCSRWKTGGKRTPLPPHPPPNPALDGGWEWPVV